MGLRLPKGERDAPIQDRLFSSLRKEGKQLIPDKGKIEMKNFRDSFFPLIVFLSSSINFIFAFLPLKKNNCKFFLLDELLNKKQAKNFVELVFKTMRHS